MKQRIEGALIASALMYILFLSVVPTIRECTKVHLKPWEYRVTVDGTDSILKYTFVVDGSDTIAKEVMAVDLDCELNKMEQ